MKVIRAFRDKKDNFKRYGKGDDYQNGDKDRVAFLVENGFLEENKQPAKEEKPEKQKKKADKK